MRILCVAALILSGSNAVAQGPFEGFEGQYLVIDQRANSTVAAPLAPPAMGADGLGQVVDVSADNITLAGLACDAWALEPAEGADLFVGDPNLADLQIAPNDPPQSAGDARLNALYRLSCEGEYVSTVFQADSQVLVVTLDNETRYLLLERVLSGAQMSALHKHLRDTKFLEKDAEVEGLDTTTLSALRGWYDYRKRDASLPTPLRIAISRNLLDGAGVWDAK